MTEPLDDLDLLFGATAGAALAALALVAAYHGVMWLAELPPLAWRRVAAVGVLLVGCGAVVGGMLGLERASARRGRWCWTSGWATAARSWLRWSLAASTRSSAIRPTA